MSGNLPYPAESGFLGNQLEGQLGINTTSLLTTKHRGQLALAAARVTCSRYFRERTADLPIAPAFSILYQLGDPDKHSCSLPGTPPYSSEFRAGSVTVVDLRETPHCEFRGPFDTLHYYVPRRALDEFAQEHGASRITTLTWNSDRQDPFVSTLSNVLLAAIEEDRVANELFLDQLALSLLAHFAQAYGGMRIRSATAEGGLAPWQERRAKEMMRARLASRLTIADVAAECRLTASHFARAFRKTTGVAPHKYLSDLRVEEAKRVMLTTKLPLVDTALISGFGDQSYFTRVFSRTVGCSPGTWRRNKSDG
jgi:AraC family transcriptional regulator